MCMYNIYSSKDVYIKNMREDENKKLTMYTFYFVSHMLCVYYRTIYAQRRVASRKACQTS